MSKINCKNFGKSNRNSSSNCNNYINRDNYIKIIGHYPNIVLETTFYADP